LDFGKCILSPYHNVITMNYGQFKLDPNRFLVPAWRTACTALTLYCVSPV